MVGVLTFLNREVFVLFDGFTIPPQPLSSGSMQVFQDARSFAPHSGSVRVRLETDVLDLAEKSWDDACPTVRRSPSIHQSDQSFELYSSGQVYSLCPDVHSLGSPLVRFSNRPTAALARRFW